MTASLGAIRAEHETLRGRLETLRETADLIELAPVEAVITELEEAYLFLEHHILPHARAEEDVLYRAYDQVANSPWATDTMRRDHDEIEKLTRELIGLRLMLSTTALTVDQKHSLRRIIYGLYAVLSLHLGNEEQLILPRLEAALTQEAADQILTSMDLIEVKQADVI